MAEGVVVVHLMVFAVQLVVRQPAVLDFHLKCLAAMLSVDSDLLQLSGSNSQED